MAWVLLSERGVAWRFAPVAYSTNCCFLLALGRRSHCELAFQRLVVAWVGYFLLHSQSQSFHLLSFLLAFRGRPWPPAAVHASSPLLKGNAIWLARCGKGHNCWSCLGRTSKNTVLGVSSVRELHACRTNQDNRISGYAADFLSATQSRVMRQVSSGLFSRKDRPHFERGLVTFPFLVTHGAFHAGMIGSSREKHHAMAALLVLPGVHLEELARFGGSCF